jgi:hypothetical protein
MNPYLEREYVWHDFHESFMPLVREVLSAQVLPRYFVRIEEHLYLHELSARERRLLGKADVSITPTSRSGDTPPTATAVIAPAEVTLPLAVDVERESFLEIRDRESRQLITVLELLSRSNKYAGPDREQYIGKRNQYLFSPAHLVEIDLLCGGPRMPINDLPSCDYYVMVSRAPDRPRAGIWPLQLADRLPVVPVPLRTGEPDATLDLQEVLHRIYDAAGYAVYVYEGSPEPELSSAQQSWAQQFLPAPS